ncbi:MAG: T9SS type A sorting domain-containing protein [Algicola sp.]|nr:T9SS type A sorting domain-containing protein [Algicola sp.]
MKKNYILFILLTLCFRNIHSQVNTVVNGFNGPTEMLLNGSDLYIAEFFGNKISKVDLSSSSPSPVTVLNNVNAPYGLALNGNDLYIAESGSNRIIKIDITQNNPVVSTVVTGVSVPYGLALNGNDLYIAEFGGSKVSKINITDNSPTLETFISGLTTPSSLLMNNTELYISDYNGGKVVKADTTINNPSASNVITGLNNVFGLFFENDLLYIADNNGRVSYVDTNAGLPSFNVIQTGLLYPVGFVKYNNELHITELLGNRVITLDAVTLSFEDIKIENNLSLWPNPVQNELHIKGLNTDATYLIVSVNGMEVLSGTVTKTINTNTINPGTYILKIKNGSKMFHYKFIKN